MNLVHRVFVLLLMTTLVLESSGAWWRRRGPPRPPQGCSTPPSPAGTTMSDCSIPYTHGKRCTYRCDTGYTQLSGSTTRTCSDGVWTGTDLVCVRGCSSPPYQAYTTRSDCFSPYTHGERCTYRCISGYTQVSGSTSRTCSNGHWTGTNLVCRRGCSSPQTPGYAIRSGCGYPYTQGERCTYRCWFGYTQVSGSTTKTCYNGHWTSTGDDLVCRRGWPTGTYGLPRTNTGCPEAAGVTWRYGYRYHDTEDDNSSNQWTPGLHFDGGYWRNNMYQKFCMKTSSWQGHGNWPSGSYCIFKGGGCPIGFQSGEVFWDDEDSNNRNRVSGYLPHGQYDRNTLIRYCCRNDGSSNTYISLPNRSPFYLFRYRQGCQKVTGMNVRDEYFRWDDEDDDNANRLQGAHPYDNGGSRNHRLHYCYYWK